MSWPTSVCVALRDCATLPSVSCLHSWSQRAASTLASLLHTVPLQHYVCVCACVCECVCVRERERFSCWAHLWYSTVLMLQSCLCVCWCACVYVCVYVFVFER